MANASKKKVLKPTVKYDDRTLEHPRIVLDLKGNPKMYPPGTSWKLENFSKEFIEFMTEDLRRERREKQKTTKKRKTSTKQK